MLNTSSSDDEDDDDDDDDESSASLCGGCRQKQLDLYTQRLYVCMVHPVYRIAKPYIDNRLKMEKSCHRDDLFFFSFF